MKKDQKEQVTPRRLAGGQFVVQLDAEGTYQCSITGLIFEVTGAARITYSLLSWSKYAHLVEKPWVVGGPLFDVRCSVPAVLSSLQFPHCLCLGGEVLHIKGGGAAIEPSAEFSASHVKWVVSSLSPVGPLIQSQQPLQYHGVVILYKAIDEHPSLSFWEIKFVDGSRLKLKSYFEVYLEKPDDFTLSVVEQDSDETVWKAKLRERDWIHCEQNKNEQRRSTASVKKRKPSLDILEEEELHSKKQKTENTAGGTWLGENLMEMKDIEDIRAMEEEVNMQKFQVLRKWRDKEQGNGTAEALQRSLGEKATHEILQALQGFSAQS
ncbi:hypothetical protein IHE44_0002124 [Lamprotornis superbus]|uniref:Uncharacterized protein n=1 Tax=Lamprotornis superbus TaxID=245042 RepID=A0A835TYZ7_9PASS|nr:hypothetical protein IHE44_0002124 [Lamprotornis superbus]